MEEQWTRFLTPRDREHLAATGLDQRHRFGLGQRPALLVVDDYYAAVGIERESLLDSIRTWPWSCGLDGWAALDRTVGLLTAARRAGIPIVYLRDMPGFPSPWGPRVPRAGLPEIPDELADRANEIVAEVAPLEGELVLEKAAASAFHGTPLLFHLNYLDVDTLLVCGEATSGCVRATVVDGATFRYRVGVIADCCFDRSEASHWINLFDIDLKYGDVMSADAVEAYLMTLS
ncbi:MAG TPA: isochorismatase family protein [Solirubrobacteraceae bacterium]|jgi:nicotinamidase-related amidase|nr:isochorismatase family protein [Solirubrobacteraceae bacterium]